MARIGKEIKRVKNPKRHVPDYIPFELPGIPIQLPKREEESVPVPIGWPVKVPQKVGQVAR